MEGSKKKDRFEEQWSSAFEDAEMSPSPHLWKNISSELANQELSGYKKRVFWFQLVAAASLLVATSLGILYFFYGDQMEMSAQEIAGTGQGSQSNGLQELAETESPIATLEGNKNNALGKEDANSKEKDHVPRSQTVADNDHLEVKDEMLSGLAVAENDDRTTSSETQADVVMLIEADEDAVADQSVSGMTGITTKVGGSSSLMAVAHLPEKIYNVPIYAHASDEEVITGNEGDFWAGITIGSGSFDPNFGAPLSQDEALSISPGAADQLTSENANLPLVEDNSPGLAVTFGIDLGKQISEKWIIQTGLQYGQYTVNSNTNLVFSSDSRESVPLSFQNNDALFNSESVRVSSNAVEIDNRFELLTIPLQAGFIILDRTFNIMLNGGLSGDFYLGNELNPSTDNVNSFAIKPGADSPYRTFYLNALTSVQFGYRIQEQFFIGLSPNYRHSLTDFAKTGNSFSSKPSRLGLNVGFRYIFN